MKAIILAGLGLVAMAVPASADHWRHRHGGDRVIIERNGPSNGVLATIIGLQLMQQAIKQAPVETLDEPAAPRRRQYAPPLK